jgi:alcohol dehydrogenase class IV
MLTQAGSVVDYLEGVGTGAVHSGAKIPFVAVPTTSGTGSEATKNAVLSRVGSGGFKKSLRHDNFVPDVAVLDPVLTLSCPPPVTAACGLDAFTQLLESYVSTQASPMTDGLAEQGISHMAPHLVSACGEGAGDPAVRAPLACGALLSGITLANAGLGVVHGLASTLGGWFEIPHGVVCGTLMASAASATIRKLQERHGPDHPALKKYARAGALVCGRSTGDPLRDCRLLVEKMEEWIDRLAVPGLSRFGIRGEDLDRIARNSGSKNNPVSLEPEEIEALLRERL